MSQVPIGVGVTKAMSYKNTHNTGCSHSHRLSRTHSHLRRRSFLQRPLLLTAHVKDIYYILFPGLHTGDLCLPFCPTAITPLSVCLSVCLSLSLGGHLRSAKSKQSLTGAPASLFHGSGWGPYFETWTLHTLHHAGGTFDFPVDLRRFRAQLYGFHVPSSKEEGRDVSGDIETAKPTRRCHRRFAAVVLVLRRSVTAVR